MNATTATPQDAEEAARREAAERASFVLSGANALELCNACDAALATSDAGYCDECDEEGSR